MLSLLSPSYLESLMFPMLLERNIAPPIEVEQTADAYVVSLEAPGVPEKNFDIAIDNGVLTISAQKKNGYFSRSMTLPSDVNDKKIAATYKYGVLTITMPKLTDRERGVRHIKVNASPQLLPSPEPPALTMSKPKFSLRMPELFKAKAKAS